jgi:hypothetical protein
VEEEIYAPWNPPGFHDEIIRERVRNAAVAMELIARENPALRCSPTGSLDLAIPVA